MSNEVYSGQKQCTHTPIFTVTGAESLKRLISAVKSIAF